MALTRLQTLAVKITDAIDAASVSGDITKQQHQKLYKAFFFILAGDPVVNPELLAFCKVRRKSKALQRIIDAVGGEIKLPQVLHANMTKDFPISSAKSLWKVAQADLRLIAKIAAIAKVDTEAEQHLLRHHYSSLDLPWFAEVEQELEDVEVIINSEALEDMLLGVIETYKVPKSKKVPFSEVFGLCLGMASRQKVTKKGTGTRTKWFVYVDKAVPQIRARSKIDSVEPNHDSIEALVETSDLLFPQLEIMGDYHSHPFHDVKELRQEKGWRASESDGTDIFWRYRTLREHPKRQHRMRVSFVVAIAKGRKHTTAASNLPGHPHVIRLSIAGCQIYLAAYRILSNGVMTTKGVTLVGNSRKQYIEAV